MPYQNSQKLITGPVGKYKERKVDMIFNIQYDLSKAVLVSQLGMFKLNENETEKIIDRSLQNESESNIIIRYEGE